MALTDDEVLEAWRELAQVEGVFCEPSSAAGLAALKREPPPPGSRVVCVLTGHGLKDPDAVARAMPAAVQVDPTPEAIQAATR